MAMARRCPSRSLLLLLYLLHLCQATVRPDPRTLLRDRLALRPPTTPALYAFDGAPLHIAPLLRQAAAVDVAQFSRGPELSSREVGLTDGTASETLYFVFTPEPGKAITDYDFSFTSSNEQCLVEEDFTLGPIQQINGGYNVSATIDFTRWVGVTDIGVVATNKNTSVTTTSSSISCTVVGMTFYRTDDNGQRIIVGGPGPNRTLQVTTEQLRNRSKVDLGVFIQYPDGTDSSESLNGNYPMSGITISTTSVEDQISHNGSACQDTGNQYNGSTVLLENSCAYGFSQNDFNGTYAGPQFGLELNPYSSGSFDINCDWPGLVTGSPLEPEGYETSIKVEITGEPIPRTPAITQITPSGPFGTDGTDTVSVILGNVPGDATTLEGWEYKFGITFPNGTIGYCELVPGSISVVDNSSAMLNFTVPAGSGSNMAWNFTVTQPSGDVVDVEDKTDPSFLFTLQEDIRLETITPSSGPESGGETISLTGFFPNFDLGNSSILFDGSPIDLESIIGFNDQSINFTLPQRSTDGYNASVSVKIGESTSNSLQFTYLPATTLKTMTPNFGPESGGTEVTLEGFFSKFDPATGQILFGGSQINNDSIVSSNETHITFTTPPRSTFGNDTQYNYDVTVKTEEDESNSLAFSYQVPISIDSITPVNGPESGGSLVTLTGKFGGFNFKDGSILIGGVKVNETNLISATSDTIKFIAPPRSEVGSEPSQEVWLSYLGVESNRMNFLYYAGGLIDIEATGPSSVGDGYYYVSGCGSSDFRATLSPAARAANPKINWTFVDPATGEDLLEKNGIDANAEIVVLPNNIYPEKNTPYILTLTVETDFARVQQRRTLEQRDSESLGVRIVDPRPVSFSNPNVTLTIPAVFSTCITTNLTIERPAITYIWEFREQSYIFSYLNLTSPRDVVGPTLLGREFQIPQKFMEYGRFPLKLTAFYTDYPNVRGADTSIVVIRPAPLVAQINGGEASQLVSEAADFQISGTRSRDPDVLEGDDTADIRYEWACIYSTDVSFATNTTCGDDLRPSVSSQSFTVESSALKSARTDGTNTYVRYTLVVSKTSKNATDDTLERVSSPVTSVLVLPAATEKKYDPFVNFEIKNNQSILMDPAYVKYYEDVIITPVSKTEDTTWEFELIEPQSESKLLSNPTNLIPYFGFFTIGARAGRYSLGILSNKLKANTKYTFKVSSFRDGFERNEQTLTVRTVAEPTVVISHFPRTTGTIGTTFIASASTNYDGDFKYYFIVTDQFGFEYCVDGCQGVKVVRFQLASAGQYAMRAEVYDSLGYTLLATTNKTVSIEVTPRTPPLDLEGMAKVADDAFLAGDHALYQQYANDMVKYIIDRNGTSTNSTLDTEIVKNITRNIGQITANSVPNPIQSTSYVRTAASIARLTPDQGIILDMDSIYTLVNITSNAIARTPDNAALQQLEDLLQFYDLTPQLLQQTFTLEDGSTGNATALRQVSTNATSEAKVRVVWADMYELMKDQITMILLKGAVCGAKQSVRTGKPSTAEQALSLRLLAARQSDTDAVTEKPTPSESPKVGEGDGDLEDDEPEEPEEVPQATDAPQQATAEARNVTEKLNPTQGQLRSSLFQVAKLCNPEQALELFIDEGTKDEVRFKSCPAVFKNSFRTLLFSVASTPDYVWLSGLQRVETRADGLVSVSVAKQAAGNKLVEEGTSRRNCYEVELPLLTTAADLAKDDTNNSAVGGVRFAPERVFDTPFERTLAYYFPGYRGTSARLVTGSRGKRALIRAARTGIYSVRAGRDRWRGISWLWIIVLGTCAVIFTLVAVIGAVVHATSSPDAGGPQQLLVPADVGGPHAYFERDVFGRGGNDVVYAAVKQAQQAQLDGDDAVLEQDVTDARQEAVGGDATG